MSPVMPETPRGWDSRYHESFVRRVRRLAVRARDPVKEEARLRTAAVRAGRIAEHGTAWADAMEIAERPLDLSAGGPPWLAEKMRTVVRHRPKPKAQGAILAEGGVFEVCADGSCERLTAREAARVMGARARPRHLHRASRSRSVLVTRTASGWDVVDAKGRTPSGVSVTASGQLVARGQLVATGRTTAKRAAASGDVVEAHATCTCQHPASQHFGTDLRGPCQICSCTKFVADEPPGELKAANVVAFGRQILDVVQALSRR